jgi:hypothetical protein
MVRSPERAVIVSDPPGRRIAESRETEEPRRLSAPPARKFGAKEEESPGEGETKEKAPEALNAVVTPPKVVTNGVLIFRSLGRLPVPAEKVPEAVPVNEEEASRETTEN